MMENLVVIILGDKFINYRGPAWQITDLVDTTLDGGSDVEAVYLGRKVVYVGRDEAVHLGREAGQHQAMVPGIKGDIVITIPGLQK